jgi:hypothetical protein
MVGRFGWLDAPMPRIVPWSWGLAVLTLLAAAIWLGRMRSRIGIALSILAVVAVPTVSEALRASKYGFIWQGRYSLPLAVGVPILCAIAVADCRPIDRRLRSVLAVASGAIVATGYVLAQVATMRRYITGITAPLLEYLTADTWHPPLAPWLLLTGTVAAAVAYTAWLVVLVRGEP